MTGTPVPRYLHLPPQILWFDLEDIGLMALMYFFYLLVDHWIALVMVVAVPWMFMNVKGSMPRGYLKHLAYRLGFWNSAHYPSPVVREHHE